MIRLILDWNSEGWLYLSIMSVYFKLFQRPALFTCSAPQQQLLKKHSRSLSVGWSWQQLGTTLLSEFSSQFWNAILLEIPKSLNPATYTAGCKIPLAQLSAESSRAYDIYSFGPCQSSCRPRKGLELAAINGWKTTCSPSPWNWGALF